MTSNKKYVYFFGNGEAEGQNDQRDVLGGKGMNLAEMTRVGVPVPPGFTISTLVCKYYNDHVEQGMSGDELLPAGIWKEVEEHLKRLEQATGKGFGDPHNPLLVSVRSGAAVSMPGMMDTILNLGLTPTTVQGLAKATENARFAWDCYRRFVQMFGNVVLEIEMEKFESQLEAAMKSAGVERDADLSAEALEKLVGDFKKTVLEETGNPFPDEPIAQLRGATLAVLKSWGNPRAKVYRRINKVHGLLGTAVNVQTMVFGNMGEDSGTGVCFTRDPATGEKVFFGEFLMNAQGEDVVAGIRTPEPLDQLESHQPEAARKLFDSMAMLEKHYREMQDMEFTIERGELFMLQTRTGKRTAHAALKIAVDMVSEGLITPQEALLKVDAQQLDQLLHPSFDPDADKKLLAKGINASPGAASGIAALTAEKAEELADAGNKVILVRRETSPEDLHGMAKSLGFLTATGGKTSHAAVVARQMGKVCVSGCSALEITGPASFKVGGQSFNEGDFISIDGTAGEVYEGEVAMTDVVMPDDFKQIMAWADKYRSLTVRTNADTPADCKVARDFGAQGIGLCRTEHMFFDDERILHVREMILAGGNPERQQEAINKLLPYQRGDFEGIFEVMDGLPVNIRLLDPPLHEFLPHEPENQAQVAKELGISPEEVKRRVLELHEMNPMLGHRGCRLGVTHPAIYEMQTRAILEAACNVQQKGIDPHPEIMIPLSSTVMELRFLRERLIRVAKKVFEEKGVVVDYQIGTMVETPRAALTGKEIAEEAEFFSFGTNDLTQMTYGFSRDDVAGFLPHYVEIGLIPVDPFDTLDEPGVGRLMQLAKDEGRETRPNLKVGICGESGGEPRSIAFCHKIGLNYVSCSPFRVPTARLAAAQAALLQS
jgi:pyruvate,orthophosphate dikinase